MDEPEKAGRVLDAMVRSNPASSAAYLARGAYHWSRGTLADSGRDVDRARQLSPEDVHVLRASAELERRRGQLDESRRYLQHGLQRDPKSLALHLTLVDLALEQNHEGEAIEYLRQGLRALPNQPDLLLLLGETLVEHGDESEVGEVIQQLRRSGSPPGLAHYLAGRLQMKHGQRARAERTLEEVVALPDRAPALACRACLALARCQGKQGDQERQRAALLQAVQFDGSSVPARMMLAAALEEAGRIDEALEQYRTLVASPQPPDDAWSRLGRLLLQRNRSRPPRKRIWNELERILDRARRLPRLEIPHIVLRAEVLFERGHDDQARRVLEQALIAHPHELQLWTALAELTRRQGKPTQSAAILEQARQRAGDRPELFEAKLALSVAQPALKVRETMRRLEKDLGCLPPEDQTRLLGKMASAWFQTGEYEDGRRLCRRLAERRSEDLPSRRALLDLALRGGEETLLAQLVADLRRLEGEEGIWWRYGEAARLLLRVQRGERNRLGEARALAADIKHRRPDWSRGALLEAYVCELEGNPAEAADAYLRAFRGGEQPPGMAERLVRLLIEHGRLDEADDVIRKAQRQTALSVEVARLGAEIALRQRGNERAVELARLAVPADADDYPSLIWLGQMLASAGRPGEAEETLRRAVRLRDDLAETWLALIAHLVRAEQLQEAENMADEMRRRLPAN
jgi:tetratricopeptide (TPR) repeat protein